MTYVKQRKGWRMSCDVGEVTETLQLIVQPFRRFTYVTAHSPSLPLLHIRHSSFFNPSFASPTSQALHVRTWRATNAFKLIKQINGNTENQTKDNYLAIFISKKETREVYLKLGSHI